MRVQSVLAREREDARVALALAEAKIKEQSEIMMDLLLKIGARKTCGHCAAPVFWILTRGGGPAVALNLDGSEHWPRCPQTRLIAVGESA